MAKSALFKLFLLLLEAELELWCHRLRFLVLELILCERVVAHVPAEVNHKVYPRAVQGDAGHFCVGILCQERSRLLGFAWLLHYVQALFVFEHNGKARHFFFLIVVVVQMLVCGEYHLVFYRRVKRGQKLQVVEAVIWQE